MPENIKNKLRKIEDMAVKNREDFNILIDQARAILEGKKIIINDENFNGQPYGHSRKSLKGKSFICKKSEYIFVHITDEGKLYIQPPDCNASLLLDHCLIEE